MADLDKKRLMRKGKREISKRRMDEVEQVLADAAGGITPDPVRLSQLKLGLEEKLEYLRRLDEDILALIDGEAEILQDMTEVDEYMQCIYDKLVRIDACLDQLNKESLQVGTLRSGTQAKLPKLDLPKFSGDITEWTTFWDLYQAAVHLNSQLSSIEKFTYLQTLVVKEAKDTISGLALTAVNYSEAIALLEARFGNKERIITKHMDTLLGLEPVSHQGNTVALRCLLDKVETHLRALKTLGVSAEAYNSLLPSVLMRKLPSELCLTISRHVSEDDWALDKLMNVLGDELKARERASEGHSKPGFISPKIKRIGSTSTVATLFCGYCSQSHSSETCRRVSGIEARKRVLQEEGKCYICLRRGHISRACRQNKRCFQCGGRHHVSICARKAEGGRNSAEASGGANAGQLDPKAEPFNSPSLFTSSHSTVLLQTARAHCFNFSQRDKKIQLRLTFDSGSQLSYISEAASNRLSLRPVGKRALKIAAFGSDYNKDQVYSIVHLGVHTNNNTEQRLTLHTVPVICQPLRGSSTAESVKGCGHLDGLNLADSIQEGEIVEIEVLIGLDHYWDFITGEVIRGGKGPVALYSSLGWILSGPVASSTASLVIHVLAVSTSKGSEKKGLDLQLKQFWDLESLGVLNQEETLYDQFKVNVVFTGERYEVALPWKDMALQLPDNYQLSLKRLHGLLRRLRQQPELFKEYSKAINDLIDKGIVERILDPSDGERIHYLPHHAVIRKDKETTKLRVVYDGSAHSNGISLNDCLHIGPKFNQYIFDILLRFRVKKCAFAADIEKAFLMIEVAKQDRDALRFLWVSDPHKLPPTVEVLRFTRVTFGVAASPFLLNATIKHHLERCREGNEQEVELLNRSMYVDDVISGAENEENAFARYTKFRELLAKGGFNLRKFICNKDCADTHHELGMHKILGITWDVDADEVVIDVSEMVGEVNICEGLTKRKLVSIVSRIFDPIGIASPITIQAKLLLQELHKAKMDWDHVITGDLLNRSFNVLRLLREGEALRVPRWYGFNEQDNELRLIGFCDASSKAYAAVVYVQRSNNYSKSTELIASKSRVAPIAALSIPRLELLGALLLARLIHSVEEALKSEIILLPSLCFSDSQVVLYWIRGVNKDWKPFAQNRVKEIRALVPAASWRHCPGQDNPADLPTRGVTSAELKKSIWFHGPPWISDDISTIVPGETDMPTECLAELRAREICNLLVVECNLSQLIDITKYSSLTKLCRITGLVLKFIESIKRGNVDQNWSVKAESLWVVECQKELLSKPKFKEWKHQFQLFKDECNVWRCGGRLHNADFPFDTVHPILLPSTHYLIKLVVHRAHHRVSHNGIKETLTELRSRYWVVKGRAIVKKFIKQCIICRKAEGGNYSIPVPPPLPSFRVRRDTPFAHTGVDFAGPLFIKNIKEIDSKIWLCLFTCCVTRAVHLDIVHSLSVDCFLSCFRRFIARRGLPERVLSDNAKTFQGAAAILKKIVNHPDVVKYFCDINVTWSFNVAKAPWWGGVFERLIQSVKRCLRKTIGRARLTYDELITVVTEVEMIINSRPLTTLGEEDIEEPLTPSHLLIGRRVSSLPDNLCVLEDDDNYEITKHFLNKRVQNLHRILDHFWSRWKHEYLLELRDIHRYHNQLSSGPDISVGDVVVIHNEARKRGFWNLGQIKELITGHDGKIRAAIVLTYTSKGTKILLKRPLQRLFPLEVNDRASNQSETRNDTHPIEVNTPIVVNNNNDTRASEDDSVPPRRSTRTASTIARDAIMAQSMT